MASVLFGNKSQAGAISFGRELYLIGGQELDDSSIFSLKFTSNIKVDLKNFKSYLTRETNLARKTAIPFEYHFSWHAFSVHQSGRNRCFYL